MPPNDFSDSTETNQSTSTSSYATISLICAILAWLGMFGLGGILAIIFGYLGKKEIRESHGRLSGDGLATAGLVLGYANVAVAVLGACLFVLVMMGVIATPLLCLPFMNEVNTSFLSIP